MSRLYYAPGGQAVEENTTGLFMAGGFAVYETQSSGAVAGLNATMDPLTLTAVGTVAIVGVSSVTMGAQTLTGVGTTAGAAIPVELMGLAGFWWTQAAGTSLYMAPYGQAFQGNEVTAADRIGTLSVTMADFTTNPNAEGTVTAGGVGGTLSVTQGAMTLTGAGTTGGTLGALSATMGAMTLTAAGTRQNILLTADGVILVGGELSVTMGVFTLTAAGTTGDASLDVTMGAMTLSATGTVGAIGTLNVTMGAFTLTAYDVADTWSPVAETDATWTPASTPSTTWS